METLDKTSKGLGFTPAKSKGLNVSNPACAASGGGAVPLPGLALEGGAWVVVDEEVFKQYALSECLFAVPLSAQSRWSKAVNKLGLDNFLIVRRGGSVVAYVTGEQAIRIRGAV